MSDYETVQVESATVYTVINHTDWPEIRKYTVDDTGELADLLLSMRAPEHAEWVFNVDLKPLETGA